MRGREMLPVDYWNCIGTSFQHEPECSSVVDVLEGIEAVCAWLDANDLVVGLAVLQEVELSGAYSPNKLSAIERACNRLWLGQTLAQADIPTLDAVIAHSIDDMDCFLHMVGEGPWVLKQVSSVPNTFDRMVMVETHEAALIALDGFRNLDRAINVQRYISEADKEDIRGLVIGFQTIGAVSRRATNASVFPSWSFSAAPVELSLQERTLAEMAANALDLGLADITLIRSNQGPLVLDANPFPQLQWWDQHRSESAADRLFDLIEARATGRGV
jgi:ribosomal protein S6--L-glutamate ligase